MDGGPRELGRHKKSDIARGTGARSRWSKGVVPPRHVLGVWPCSCTATSAATHAIDRGRRWPNGKNPPPSTCNGRRSGPCSARPRVACLSCDAGTAVAYDRDAWAQSLAALRTTDFIQAFLTRAQPLPHAAALAPVPACVHVVAACCIAIACTLRRLWKLWCEHAFFCHQQIGRLSAALH